MGVLEVRVEPLDQRFQIQEWWQAELHVRALGSREKVSYLPKAASRSQDGVFRFRGLTFRSPGNWRAVIRFRTTSGESSAHFPLWVF